SLFFEAARVPDLYSDTYSPDLRYGPGGSLPGRLDSGDGGSAAAYQRSVCAGGEIRDATRVDSLSAAFETRQSDVYSLTGATDCWEISSHKESRMSAATK